MKAGPTEGSLQGRPPGTGEQVADAPNFLGVRHVGLLARNPHGLAVFYRDIMGMGVVRQTFTAHGLGGTAFLARHPDQEDHDLVFVSNPKAAHTAFRVASLADLLSFYRRLKEHGIPIQNCFNHVVELAVYFEDPEGHSIEVYWATGLSSSEAHADSINLEVSEEQLRLELARLEARFGRPEHAPGGGEAAFLDDTHECFQALQPVHDCQGAFNTRRRQSCSKR